MDEDNGGLWHADIFPQLSPPVSRTAATATATVLGVSIVVVRVSVSGPRPLGPPSSGIVSSIAKERVTLDHLELSELNLDGDDQSDREVHGGLDKAVYSYPSEHLQQWAVDLDQPALADSPTAPFGENISTLGATEDDVCIGDIWSWGTAVLQVAQPRWPCQKLSLHRGTAVVGGMMRSSGRTGWYLRVLETGVVDVAGPIEVAEKHPAGLSVRAANDAMLDRSLLDRSTVEALAMLDGVLADEWRLPLVERLSR
jgi:MOSC domain-containing protein YiiM